MSFIIKEFKKITDGIPNQQVCKKQKGPTLRSRSHRISENGLINNPKQCIYSFFFTKGNDIVIFL